MKTTVKPTLRVTFGRAILFYAVAIGFWNRIAQMGNMEWCLDLLDLLMLAGVPIFVYLTLIRLFTTYSISDEAVMKSWGILFRRSSVVPLKQICDASIRKPPIGMLVGAGDLFFSSAGSNGAEIKMFDMRNRDAKAFLERIQTALQGA